MGRSTRGSYPARRRPVRRAAVEPSGEICRAAASITVTCLQRGGHGADRPVTEANDIVATATEASGAARSPCSCWTRSRPSSTGTASAMGPLRVRGIRRRRRSRTSASCSNGETSATSCAGPHGRRCRPRRTTWCARRGSCRACHAGRAAAPDRRRVRGRGRAGRAVLRDGVRRRPRRPRRAGASPRRRRRAAVGDDLVDTLVEIHAADVVDPDLAAVRPAGQLPRAAGAPLPAAVGRSTRRARLPRRRGRRAARRAAPRAACRHASSTATTGSATSSSSGSAARVSVPCSTGRWARSATPCRPRLPPGRHVQRAGRRRRARSGSSPVTALAGFPSSAELVARYEERTGRGVERLGWFEALALWKAAVFCEAIYGRFARGELGARRAGRGVFDMGCRSWSSPRPAPGSWRSVRVVTEHHPAESSVRPASPRRTGTRAMRSGTRLERRAETGSSPRRSLRSSPAEPSTRLRRGPERRLARRAGWRVIGVDFSDVAIAKAALLRREPWRGGRMGRRRRARLRASGTAPISSRSSICSWRRRTKMLHGADSGQRRCAPGRCARRPRPRHHGHHARLRGTRRTHPSTPPPRTS